MGKFRLLLLPFGAVAEMLAIILCWFLSLVNTALAYNVMSSIRENLPTASWYMGDN